MPRVESGRGRGLALSLGQDWSSEGSDGDDQETTPSGQRATAIQGGIFEQYLDACDDLGDGEDDSESHFAQGLVRVQEYLSAARDNACCLICLGAIKPSAAVWQCSGGCHAVFHLVCMQEWARSQLDAAAARAALRLSPDRFPAAEAGARAAACWGCPKCRAPYPASALPSAYTCFCGKAVDPPWDPWLAPHSCGEVCGRRLEGSCGHSCLLLCHPGPCPPCPRAVDAACYCGATSTRRRCAQAGYACGGTCGRLLTCGRHACPDPCHPGDCAPCAVPGSYACACGAERRELACSESAWQCGRACGRPLGCGRHSCGRVCHSGECGGCEFAGTRSCPCGKQTYPELGCDDKVPTCGGTCGKLLSCHVHRCTERCHQGDCPQVCRELVTKPCRCGSTQREVLCTQEVLCERRCTATRSCGRHPCKRRCCDGGCPPCAEPCNRRLRCGNHRCPAPCHPGACQPCPLTFCVSCACGRTRNTLPCGAEAGALPPRCAQACPVPALCRHAAAGAGGGARHRCHFGPCPGCKLACGALLACGHPCSSVTCHDPAPPPVAPWEAPRPIKGPLPQASSAARAGAGAQAPAAAAAAAAADVLAAAGDAAVSGGGVRTRCPPCSHPVTVVCLGGHSSARMPCHEAAPFACDQRCGKRLACGSHNCAKPCHAPPGAPRGEPCAQCERRCGAVCAAGHACGRPCHTGSCASCEVGVDAACRCGKTTLHFPCHEHQRLVSQPPAAAAGAAARGKAAQGQAQEGDRLSCGRPCHKALPLCGHPCRASCHSGGCPQPERCAEPVGVRCECRRLKTKWACWQVQDALQAARGGGRAYDATTPLRLLPCDAECAAQAKKGRASSSGGAAGGGAAGTGAAAETAAEVVAAGAAAAQQQQLAAATTVSARPGAKKLSRAERDALAAQRLEQQERQLARRRLRQRLLGLIAVVVIVLAVMGLARLFAAGVDSFFQATSAPPQAGGASEL